MENSQPTLLVIDDEPEVCEVVNLYFKDRFRVLKSTDPFQGLSLLENNSVDIVLCDQRFQGSNLTGLDICKTLRKSSKNIDSIFMLITGYDNVATRVNGFECDIDDFIAKPFHFEELTARIESRLRKRDKKEENSRLDISGSSRVFGNLELDSQHYEVTVSGRRVPLSVTETKLLSALLQGDGKVVRREDILKSVWGDVVVSERTIDAHIVKLRRKLELFDHEIDTVYGIGYAVRKK